MTLACADTTSDFGLRQPVGLNFFDKFGPVHNSQYRICNSQSQRLCGSILGNTYRMGQFAERVRKLRKDAKLSQKQLAVLADLSQTTISDIERGRNEGSRDIVALARALKVNAEWLMHGGDSMPPKQNDGTDTLLECWAWLLPSEKQSIIEQIRPMAARNREAASHFGKPVPDRVVRQSDRRQANLPIVDDRRSKEG